MYTDVSLWLAIIFVLAGLYTLAKSADVFVEGSAALAERFCVPPFIIGMVIIGFGTSLPEACVSALSAFSGHSALSFGNAFGSCIFNILAILGVVAFIVPIVISKNVMRFGVPILLAITALEFLLVKLGGGFSRIDGIISLIAFGLLLPLYCIKEKADQKSCPITPEESKMKNASMVKLCSMTVAGLVLLVASSHFLVWGCVDIAKSLHVSELMIGLTVVAVGTSLPELASAIAAARKKEHELVVGNIIGSNLFNTLAVVGLAGTISPFKDLSKFALYRDLPVSFLSVIVLAICGYNWCNRKEDGKIGIKGGIFMILLFVMYVAVMFCQEIHT